MTAAASPFPAYRLEEPSAPLIPVVYDSPHSGAIYPDDFDVVLDRMLLRQAEDAYVDDLFAHVTAGGAPLLHALFPRSYIDPNRAETDLDLEMIDGAWPGPVAPTSKTTRRGVGLIWRRMRMEGDLYARKLTPDEVARRIEGFWRPYHAALKALLDAAHARFGVVYHVDCHSMPSMGDAQSEDGPRPRADFVIGDLDGTSCGPAFTELVTETLRAEGYTVAVNDPYKGFELTRRYAEPGRGRNALQLEISRALYMEETTLARIPAYETTRAALMRLTDAIAAFAASAR